MDSSEFNVLCFMGSLYVYSLLPDGYGVVVSIVLGVFVLAKVGQNLEGGE